MPSKPQPTMDELPIAACNLDLDGLRTQRDRYRQLGRTARRIQREPQKLTVEFAPDVDAALLAETIAIESECCPFFELRYDAATHELFAGVNEPDQDPALDALVAALTKLLSPAKPKKKQARKKH